MIHLGSDEIFFLSITAYALALTDLNSGVTNTLWKMNRKDSEYTKCKYAVYDMHIFNDDSCAVNLIKHTYIQSQAKKKYI